MKITELLDKRSISLDAAPASKSEALDLAVELMAAGGKLSDVEAYRRQVYAREEESTTGIGEGIAIPHGKCDAVKKPGLAAMVIRDGVDFDSLDCQESCHHCAYRKVIVAPVWTTAFVRQETPFF